MLAGALLAAELAAFAYFFRGDFGELAAIAGLPGAAMRRRRYRVRIAKTALLFGASAVAAVALLGRIASLATLPPEFAGLTEQLGGPEAELVGPLAIGGAGGTLIGVGWTWWRRRRGQPPAMLGDYAMLFPHDRREAGLALGAALAAGVGEELYFRLALPLLVAGATGSAALGFALSTAMFGAAHRYQRWAGVVATTLMGALFAGVYLLSGRLWLAIAGHVLVDVNALVLRPWVSGLIRRRAED